MDSKGGSDFNFNCNFDYNLLKRIISFNIPLIFKEAYLKKVKAVLFNLIAIVILPVLIL